MMIISTNHDIGQHHVDVDHHVIGYVSVGIGNILNIAQFLSMVSFILMVNCQHHDDHLHHDIGQHHEDHH